MNTEALQRLREPAAYLLLGAAAVQVLAGLISLFAGAAFTSNAFGESYGAVGSFTGFILAALVVGAVLLATSPAPSAAAKTIVTGALAVVGVGLALGVITLFAGLLSEYASGGDKAAAFFFGLSKIAISAGAGYYVFLNFKTFQPARPAQVPGQVYGQQPYADPYAQQQQQYGQQPQQYGQPQYGVQDPYAQPGAQQPAAQPGQDPYSPQHSAPADPYAQGQYGQPGQQYGQSDAYGQPAQPGQPAQGQPQYGQQPQQDPGGWTRQFGDDAAGQPQQPQQSDQNWYRGDQGPQ
ncbi:hypothetical protein [Actinocorallia sp. A-T 12471]|uniref:hypothetical protein n=1 Tax=Actinocorallia sp. A-T 12471 TaxID=3089813 RepID=UPI0029D372BE|nr:hypothetical protein [Actinocorallia sp. A-T 12471]MDX6744614.1 hypothetical protein [Actinocorallia sp. A-T 12471]